MDVLEALERTADHAEQLVAGVRPEHHPLPTPCGDWDVRTLLNHTVAGAGAFGRMLRDEPPLWMADHLTGDPVATFRAGVQDSLAAWRAGGLARTVEPLGGLPLAELQALDLLVHGWDLARATGQPDELPADVAARAWAVWSEVPVDVGRSMGQFGPEVPVPAGAPVGDRLLGLLGRDPAWTP